MHSGVFKAFAAYISNVYRHHRVALGLEMFSDSGNTIPSGESSVGEVQPVDATSATNFGTDDDATRDRISSHRLKQSRHNCIIFYYRPHPQCT